MLKVKADGTFTNLAEKVEVNYCDEDIPDDPTVRMPALRGLAVDARGRPTSPRPAVIAW